MERHRMIARLAALLLAGAIVTSPGLASANGTKVSGKGTTVSGLCGGGPSHYALNVQRYDATHLKVTYTLSSSVNGQTWQLFGSDNGTRVFSVNKVVNKKGVAAAFVVVANQSGTDQVKATAYNATTGATCGASVAF